MIFAAFALSLNTDLSGFESNFITTYFDIDGSDLPYFYMHGRDGYILISLIAIDQQESAVESISHANGLYTIRLNSNLASGKIYRFAQMWMKLGLNA